MDFGQVLFPLPEQDLDLMFCSCRGVGSRTSSHSTRVACSGTSKKAACPILSNRAQDEFRLPPLNQQVPVAEASQAFGGEMAGGQAPP
jgi:hypothetical protein